ncbi:MAG: type II toxin-antitoxin system Phd/YefM family antitoxin [Rhodospirillales bacterium]|jgi:prevent-host-death family protein|nr:type II toxin-antitoxin system Phd/YefM family antitoxin [Rhodospirillales bacterium]
MRSMAAKEAKNHFGELLDTARREPVTIERNGRPVAVVLSIEDFKRFEEIEDAVWGERALEADKDGYAGIEEGEKLLKEFLGAKT